MNELSDEEDDAQVSQYLKRIKRLAMNAQERTEDDMACGWLGAIKAICDFGILVNWQTHHSEPMPKEKKSVDKQKPAGV